MSSGSWPSDEARVGDQSRGGILRTRLTIESNSLGQQNLIGRGVAPGALKWTILPWFVQNNCLNKKVLYSHQTSLAEKKKNWAEKCYIATKLVSQKKKNKKKSSSWSSRHHLIMKPGTNPRYDTLHSLKWLGMILFSSDRRFKRRFLDKVSARPDHFSSGMIERNDADPFILQQDRGRRQRLPAETLRAGASDPPVGQASIPRRSFRTSRAFFLWNDQGKQRRFLQIAAIFMLPPTIPNGNSEQKLLTPLFFQQGVKRRYPRDIGLSFPSNDWEDRCRFVHVATILMLSPTIASRKSSSRSLGPPCWNNRWVKRRCIDGASARSDHFCFWSDWKMKWRRSLHIATISMLSPTNPSLNSSGRSSWTPCCFNREVKRRCLQIPAVKTMTQCPRTDKSFRESS